MSRQNCTFILHKRYPQIVEKYHERFETTISATDNGLSNVFTKYTDNFSRLELELSVALNDWQIKTICLNSFQAPYGQSCLIAAVHLPKLSGLKGLPGFRKKLYELLGENQSCHHLSASIIDTIKTCRQLAIVPRPLLHLLNFQDSIKMRQLDLLLFPNIGNSCWAYNLESGSLIPGSGGTKLNSSMYPIEGEVHQPFRRTKEISALIQEGCFVMQVQMKDNVHQISLETTIRSEADQIVNTKASFDGFPYYGICEEMTNFASRLEGIRIDNISKEKIYNHVGGPRGCTHLVDFFIDLIDLYPLLKPSEKRFEQQITPHLPELALNQYPFLKGTCAAFRSE